MKTLSTIDAIKKLNWPTVKPKSCEITLHYNCNAKCIFCYTENALSKINIDIEKAIIHLKKSYDNGSTLCQIIGGEPTIYTELNKIIISAKKIGYPIIQIVTNGIKLADYKFLKNLKYCGLNSITFSVHSHISKKHDKIVGVKNAFSKIIKAIENAIKLDIHITIGTAVTYINHKDIPHIVSFFHQKYHIESFHIIALHLLGQVYKSKNKLLIKYSQTLPYIKKTIEYLASEKAFPLSQILSNYTPCLLPGYEDLISDWKIPYFDDDLILPEKTYYNSMYTMITDNLRMKTNKCKQCIYYKICAGFEKKYYEEFGDSEFKPLNKIHKAPNISCFYKK
ncbi:MAG: radical SAM protein [Elusimicrobiales bacterium]|nr:radical SAM protein [Elusimicrobiales bacterium]